MARVVDSEKGIPRCYHRGMPRPTLRPDDLAPGDRWAARFDWSGLQLQRIADVEHPFFSAAYARLWREFGARGEMEELQVVADRLAWNPARPPGEVALAYEMLVVRRGDELVAVRDHSAIVARDGLAVVHLSHVLVEPEWRGSGLAGWLRSLPIQAARNCAAAAGITAPLRLVLAAEMEPRDPHDPASLARLRSYERAGFKTLAIPYAQPDFRPLAEIAASRFEPLPLSLVIRRVGREDEPCVSGREAAGLIGALYSMFGVHLRSSDEALLRQRYEDPAAALERVDLLAPTR